MNTAGKVTKETLIQISMSIKFQQNLNNINEHSQQNNKGDINPNFNVNKISSKSK